MPLNLKVSGVWKTAQPHVRVSGVWKLAKWWLRVSGVWKLVSAIFDQPDGLYSDVQGFGITASVTLSAQVPVTWTYSAPSGGPGQSVSIASGAVATSITFSLLAGPVSSLRNASWGTVTGNDGAGSVGNYSVYLEVDNP